MEYRLVVSVCRRVKRDLIEAMFQELDEGLIAPFLHLGRLVLELICVDKLLYVLVDGRPDELPDRLAVDSCNELKFTQAVY